VYNIMSRSRARANEERFLREVERHIAGRRRANQPASRQLEPPRYDKPYALISILIHEVLRIAGDSKWTLTELMGLSGDAFRLTVPVRCSWKGISTYDWSYSAYRMLERLGYGGTCYGRPGADAVSPERQAAMLSSIQETIDRGLPVIAWNLAINEFGYLHGYNDEERTLAYSSYGCKTRGVRYDRLGRSPGEPPLFLLAGTDIILDSNIWGFPPTIMFDTRSIDESRAFCDTLTRGFMTDVMRFEDVSFFNINANMVCQAHRLPEPEASGPVHPLLHRIVRVVVHADDMRETVGWYETFLQRRTETVPWTGELPYIRMDRGAHVLIDDNRLSQTPRVRYDRLQLDFRVNPIAVIESGDIEAAQAYVRSKGAQVPAGLESRLGVRFFTFYDPDGNGLMVCEGKKEAAD